MTTTTTEPTADGQEFATVELPTPTPTPEPRTWEQEFAREYTGRTGRTPPPDTDTAHYQRAGYEPRAAAYEQACRLTGLTPWWGQPELTIDPGLVPPPPVPEGFQLTGYQLTFERPGWRIDAEGPTVAEVCRKLAADLDEYLTLTAECERTDAEGTETKYCTWGFRRGGVVREWSRWEHV